MRQYRHLPIVLLAVLMLIWGYSWIPGKLGVINSSPFMFAALRSVPAALLLMALLPITRRSLRPKAVWLTAVVGVLQMAGFTAFISAALATGGAGHSAMLANTWQFWLLVLAWLFLGEKLVRYQWAAVALAIAGLVLIVEPWGLRGVTSSLLTLAGAMCFAVGAVVAKVLRRRQKLDLLSFTAWQAVFGSIPLIILAAAVPGDPIKWNVDFIWSLIFSALIGTALAGVLWLYILNSMPANMAGIGTIGTPVIGVLASWLQLGERLTPWEIAGMVLVVSALALLALRGAGVGRHSPVLTTEQGATPPSSPPKAELREG